jgi:hypothetical protein
MNTNRHQMILVAVVVCLFSVGMAGLLNFFKYRSTAEHLIEERLIVTGRAIENSIQASLALGLQFADIGTLQGTLERERGTDDLILGIDVFDIDGKPLYSTDRLRASRNVASSWLDAARLSKGKDWSVKSGTDTAAGIAIENNFGVIVGYLALRYSDELVSQSTHAVARELTITVLGLFLVSSTLASLALMGVMRSLIRDFAAVEAELQSGHSRRASAVVEKGPFGRTLKRFLERVRSAEMEIALVRSTLERGAER